MRSLVLAPGRICLVSGRGMRGDQIFPPQGKRKVDLIVEYRVPATWKHLIGGLVLVPMPNIQSEPDKPQQTREEQDA